ncbi:hypothetical protein U9M48_013757 [Paspalum notatum var. saurae]|uniref:Uncharacterized protein n=1 Tax=Paspalum notatum var. saurae TaxID=547442 RepID=A0AAQ3WK10_PASNO
MARSNCYGPVSTTLETTPRGHVPGSGPIPAAPLSSSWWIDGRVAQRSVCWNGTAAMAGQSPSTIVGGRSPACFFAWLCHSTRAAFAAEAYAQL